MRTQTRQLATASLNFLMIDLTLAVNKAAAIPQRPAREYPQSEESIRLRADITAWVANKGQAKADCVAKQFKIHKSTAFAHLKQLVEEKALAKKITATGHVYQGVA